MVRLADMHGDTYDVTESDCCPSCGRPFQREYPAGMKLTVQHFTTPNGETIKIGYREYQILNLLLRHFGQTVHRARIYTHVWSDSETDIKTLDTYQCKLNKKLRPLGLKIQSIWGIGKVLDFAVPNVASVNNSVQAA